MNSIFFSLSQPIDANKLLAQLQKLIHKQDSLTDKLIRIEIVSISNDNTEMIPKLEDKSCV